MGLFKCVSPSLIYIAMYNEKSCFYQNKVFF